MYIRTLHRQLADSFPSYKTATAPLLFVGRKISTCIPERLRLMIDRILCAVEIAFPKIATVLGAAALAFATGAPYASTLALGSLIWFAHDIADHLQYYPYDYLEDMSAGDIGKDNSQIVVRPELIERVAFYLSKQRANNNVLMLGPAGCGKTSTAHAIAELIQSPKCPPDLKNKTIYRVRLDKMMANIQRPGDFEMRFVMLLNAVSCNSDTIIFIDEAHQLLDRRGNGNTSLANLLKPFLTDGMRCLAATTKKEYKKYIEEDEGFAQRFNLVELPVLKKKTCIAIMQRKYPGLSEKAALTAIAAAGRLYPKNALPRSGLLLLENAMHATRATPTQDSILEQEKFEMLSLGSLHAASAA